MAAVFARVLRALRLGVPLVAALAAVSLPAWEHGTDRAHAAAFIVNSNADDPDAVPGDGVCSNAGGVCTLRAAIEELNATGFGDVINFSNPWVIQPSSPLPNINVDGVTISGLAPGGRVMLDGQFAGAANGLVLNSSFNDITGLAISNFQLAGIRVEAGTVESTIANNRIGTNTAGTAGAGNGVGVSIAGNDNTLGGSAALLRNIISGNSGNGVIIEASTGNQVFGNYIGTNAAGTMPIGNGGNGVYVFDASSNSVGATGSGNVISGNALDGVLLRQTIVGTNDGNTVAGNLIGTNAAGDATMANGSDGVQTQGVVSNLTIGGTTAGERNVISGNLEHGVSHKGGGGVSVLVRGNYIGTSVNGMADLGNGTSGVYSEGNNLTIGGTAAGTGNVISGNTMHGVFATVRDVRILGNTIGLASDGATALGNGQHGVLLYRTQAPSEIGSAPGSGRNVISANGIHGISLVGDPVNPDMFPARATIVNNYIGTDVTGTLDRGNAQDGVHVHDSDGSVIGTIFGQQNVISGNSGSGVYIRESSGNQVAENLIGTNAAGTADLGNDQYGVVIDLGSANNIGVPNFASHSLISGNGGSGVILLDTTGNTVRNVYLGTNYAGTAAIPNEYGVSMDAASSNVVGGPNPGEGNLISGNLADGVQFGGASNAVQGNLIGTTWDGAGAVPNGRYGVHVLSAASSTIGGFTPATRNVISGNTSDGIRVSGLLSADTNVHGNYIGVDSSGVSRLANGGAGVLLDGTSSVEIGGNGPGNVISGNTGPGIYLTNSTTATLVSKNVIGPQANGTTALAAGTGTYGVLVANGAHDNVIGSLVPSAGNQIAYHTGDGIRIQGAATLNNVVLGNSIHSNTFKGIETFDGGNGEPAPPVITSANGSGASGTSTCASCRISVYSDSSDEGRNYHGTTTTNGAGAWAFVGTIASANATATVEFANGNTSEFSVPAGAGGGDTDGDGCSDIEENGTNEIFGGDRNPNDFWDFFDVTGDKAIDLSDALDILDHFGALPGQPAYDAKYDRYAPNVAKPWRTAAATGNNVGIDLQDALVNLQSFGHNCSAPP